ncbi:MAG: hypothetical protein JW940_02395 [Polyangiaceae bacterium]|nr:hypothetical protein [Polyangiaceae bacterium]
MTIFSAPGNVPERLAGDPFGEPPRAELQSLEDLGNSHRFAFHTWVLTQSTERRSARCLAALRDEHKLVRAARLLGGGTESGMPTAPTRSLDADVIIAAQVETVVGPPTELIRSGGQVEIAPTRCSVNRRELRCVYARC